MLTITANIDTNIHKHSNNDNSSNDNRSSTCAGVEAQYQPLCSAGLSFANYALVQSYYAAADVMGGTLFGTRDSSFG